MQLYSRTTPYKATTEVDATIPLCTYPLYRGITTHALYKAPYRETIRTWVIHSNTFTV